jgi:hypothetical protein
VADSPYPIYLNHHEIFNNSPAAPTRIEFSNPNNSKNTTIGKTDSESGQSIIKKFQSKNDAYQVTYTVKSYTGYEEDYNYKNSAKTYVRSGEYLIDLTTTKNDAVIADWTDLKLSVADAVRFSGQKLNQIQYQWEDDITGTPNDDIIWGYTGSDDIRGGEGNDILDGGDGDDTIFGGDGDDHIAGGWGINVISGGTGTDTVHMNQKKSEYLFSKDPSDNRIYVYSKTSKALGSINNDVEIFTFSDHEVATKNSFSYTGKISVVPLNAETPVYRFYNNKTEAFFYTADLNEKQYVEKMSYNANSKGEKWPFIYQGSTFSAAKLYGSSYEKIVPLHKFYNTGTDTHFYTASSIEASTLQEKIALGDSSFTYSGPVFDVYLNDPTPTFQGKEAAVYRFYNSSLDSHFYTADLEEKALITLVGGWNYEGIAFYGEII